MLTMFLKIHSLSNRKHHIHIRTNIRDLKAKSQNRNQRAGNHHRHPLNPYSSTLKTLRMMMHPQHLQKLRQIPHHQILIQLQIFRFLHAERVKRIMKNLSRRNLINLNLNMIYSSHIIHSRLQV